MTPTPGLVVHFDPAALDVLWFIGSVFITLFAIRLLRALPGAV